MDKLIVHPSVTSTWHSLVTQACQVRSITLSEDIESYLVYLLMRFSRSPDLLSKIIATDYLQAAHLGRSARAQQLREVGDSCLLYSGFFPGMARKRHVTLSYYVNIGRQAYNCISDQQVGSAKSAELYRTLGQEFVALMDLLLAIREMDGQAWLDPLQALEGVDIGSQYSMKTLQQHTNSQSNPALWPVYTASKFKH